MSEAALEAPRSRASLRVAGWLVLAALVALALRRIDLGDLRETLRGASLWPVALAVLCNVVANTSARARRWQALLAPLPHRQRAGFFDLARLVYAGYAASNLLPARAGEAVRVVELHRRRGYPLSGLVAVQLAEKFVEALSLGLLCGVAALTAGPGRTPLAVAGGLALCGFVFLVALPRRVPLQEPLTGVRRFLHALRTVHARRSWLRSLGWSLLSDTTDLLLVGLCLGAVGIDVPPSAWALVLMSVNLAILLPSTPGQVGALEAGGVVALAAAGVAPAPALAFALLYHCVHLVPSTALGLLGMCLPW